MATAKNFTVKELRDRLRRSNVAPAGIDKMKKQNLINALTRAGKLQLKAAHPLNAKTVPELRKMAKNAGHVGYSKLVKANLINLLNRGKKRSPSPVKFQMPVTYINSPGLTKMTLQQLKNKASKVGLVGRSKMNKKQLIRKMTTGAISPIPVSPLKGILKEMGQIVTKSPKAVKFSRIISRKLGFAAPKSPMGKIYEINKPFKTQMNNRPKPVSRYREILASIKTS